MLVIALTWSAVTAVNAQVPPAPVPETSPVTDRIAVEKIVREYMLGNPSILREIVAALQESDEKEKRSVDLSNVRAKHSELFEDVASPEAGNPKGKVKVVVFFDYFCGYCKRSLQQLDELLARDNSIRIIYKEFPILGKDSEVAASAALAAHRQGRYVDFHKLLLAGDNVNKVTLRKLAKQVGLNYRSFLSDMDDPGIKASLQRNSLLANHLNIDGTPAYIIGDRVVRGAVNLAELERIIAEVRSDPAGTAPKPK